MAMVAKRVLQEGLAKRGLLQQANSPENPRLHFILFHFTEVDSSKPDVCSASDHCILIRLLPRSVNGCERAHQALH